MGHARAAPPLLEHRSEVVQVSTKNKLLAAIQANPRGSYREWATAAGISSSSVVSKYLGILAAEKKIKLNPGKPRSVELIQERADEVPADADGLGSGHPSNRAIGTAIAVLREYVVGRVKSADLEDAIALAFDAMNLMDLDGPPYTALSA